MGNKDDKYVWAIAKLPTEEVIFVLANKKAGDKIGLQAKILRADLRSLEVCL